MNATRPTSVHFDITLKAIAEFRADMEKQAPKYCVWVRTPDGERVECEVLETIYSPNTIFEQAYVRALHGAPFNGQNCAVVPMNGNVSAVRERSQS